VALRGSRADGHRFVEDAIARGAAAAVVEDDFASVATGATVVRVDDTRRALSRLAAAFYRDPSAVMDVIGVTGTNGKTTTCHMIAAILNEAGVACGIIGTVGAEFGELRWQLQNTTPLPPELQELLAAMRDSGARTVAMEVSSHALALERVEDVRFRAAVLTNVTRDHLDFHETLESYAAAKRRLFDLSPACIMNVDDAYGRHWISELTRLQRVVVTYGWHDADLVAGNFQGDAFASTFTVGGRRYELQLPGRFNVENALAAIAVAKVFDIDDATSAHALANLRRIPGRMEHLRGNGIDVIVDYAHTPDALYSALRSLREGAKGALAVVFGCGGDRDSGKRAQMGAVAAKLADRIYVTSDNPRSEDPRTIADAIVAGVGSHEHVVELDRRSAIELAIREAKAGDVLLIAGKGHEKYQIVGDSVVPFDDLSIAREALRIRTPL
jgi:UDP-N-acetylmuramyl-tripeptide synthetase